MCGSINFSQAVDRIRNKRKMNQTAPTNTAIPGTVAPTGQPNVWDAVDNIRAKKRKSGLGGL